jgi:alkylation response protein AidB-like acyl-CoA dehydrogenase
MPITLYGTEEQNKKMPKLASEWFGACLTEPGAGSDANSGKRKQFYQKMEKHTRLQVKMWISNAGFCSVFIVLHVLVMIKYYRFYR